MSAVIVLLFGLLDLAELVVHLHTELVGGATELVHQFADVTGKLGELLRSEEQQGDEEDDGAVLKTGHVLSAMIRQDAWPVAGDQWSVGRAEL
jgi:phage-related minor tail protein